MELKQNIQDIFDIANVKLNGNNPEDICVYDCEFYSRVLRKGSIGLGESYMDKLWDCKSLDKLFYRIFTSGLNKKAKNAKFFLRVIKSKLMNLQKKSKAYEIGRKHYDTGNNLYRNMLDKRMIYSCGYWKNAKNLDQAQENKLDLICKKIGLKPGMKILDIGCGWGGFAKYAAEKYKVEVVGITISKKQEEFAKKICRGIPVEIRLQDYRNLDEKFDRIISIGMFEHVGPKNYRTYFKKVSQCLKPGGLFLLHTIGKDFSSNSIDPWINKYIFPNAVLPSANQITSSAEGLFVLEDWHNFGIDYDKTLMAWENNFSRNWNKIKKDKNYDERFYRMWKYYLLSCAGSFRARVNHVWQIIFSKNGVKGGYKSIR
ncbi:MAG: cyclopropane fatty acyl phospholipid synthase [Nanoarchaeota archaeon]|nr:cyclopropane fatty acyl phospholipid synthase [Nanoarchaeota archaeon]